VEGRYLTAFNMSEHVKSNGPERLESDEFVEYETTKTTKRTGVKRKCVYSNVSNSGRITLNCLKLHYENITRFTSTIIF